MRIAIIGNSGSGKSTLARELAATHAWPMLDLDTVAWEPRKIAVARDRGLAIGDVRAFCSASESWIVEGCYAEFVGAALEFEPLLVFLDPGVEACLANCASRPWEPHKYASKREQDEKLEFLLTWVRDHYVRDGETSYRAHRALFDGYSGSKTRPTARIGAHELADPTRFTR